MLHMNAEQYVEQMRQRVRDNRDLWGKMNKAGIVSYNYLRLFALGKYPNPGICTMYNINEFIKNNGR